MSNTHMYIYIIHYIALCYILNAFTIVHHLLSEDGFMCLLGYLPRGI